MTVNATVARAFEQGQKPGVFTFVRTGNTASPLTVTYRMGGTATKWDDYRRPQGDMPEFVTFPAGATAATLTLVPVDDKVLEGPETVTLTITTNAAYNIGSPNTAAITIEDNELAPRTCAGPDSDGDGMCDADEILAGTDPQEPLSALKIISFIRSANGGATVTWSSVPGKTYRVARKDGSADPYWSDVSGPIAATGPTTSWTDESAGEGPSRIYCIVVVS